MTQPNRSPKSAQSQQIRFQSDFNPSLPSSSRLLGMALALGLLAASGVQAAGSDRSESARPRSELAPSREASRDYLHSLRCTAELVDLETSPESYDQAVLRSPEFSLPAQEAEEESFRQRWASAPIHPDELLLGARDYRESVECGQDGPGTDSGEPQGFAVMPEISLLRQQLLRTRQVPERFASLPQAEVPGEGETRAVGLAD